MKIVAAAIEKIISISSQFFPNVFSQTEMKIELTLVINYLHGHVCKCMCVLDSRVDRGL